MAIERNLARAEHYADTLAREVCANRERRREYERIASGLEGELALLVKQQMADDRRQRIQFMLSSDIRVGESWGDSAVDVARSTRWDDPTADTALALHDIAVRLSQMDRKDRRPPRLGRSGNPEPTVGIAAQQCRATGKFTSLIFNEVHDD
jgi:hypothetical protein